MKHLPQVVCLKTVKNRAVRKRIAVFKTHRVEQSKFPFRGCVRQFPFQTVNNAKILSTRRDTKKGNPINTIDDAWMENDGIAPLNIKKQRKRYKETVRKDCAGWNWS